jgi:thermitase
MRRWLRIGCVIVGLGSLLSGFYAQVEEAPACVPQRVMIKFRAPWLNMYADRIAASLGARVEDALPQIGVLMLQIPPEADEKLYAEALSRHSIIQFAEPDYIVEPAQLVHPNDPEYDPPALKGWHLARIGCPAAWFHTRGNPRIIIAHLDTGVDANHPDLRGKLVPGWNFYDNNANTDDHFGHGTATAGVVAAATSNGVGIASVGWNCRIMPLRISNPEGGAALGIAARALIWAADRGARVAVLTYGMTHHETVREAAQYFMRRARGVVVISAGNGSYFDPRPDNPFVITVSATNPEDYRAPWSTHGNGVDLCAPGEQILTTNRGGGYSPAMGTSYSAPIVAGVAALVLSVNPALSGEQLQRILFQSANDLGAPGWDPEYGWGCVNAARAVALARWLPMDRQPPAIALESPAPNSTVTGIVPVRVSVQDRSGVYRVQLYHGDRLLGTRMQPPYDFPWDTRFGSNGPNAITVVAQDGAGNIGRATFTVHVNNPEDRHPPTITITEPADGTVLQGDGLVVRVNAQDDVGVVRVELYVNNSRYLSTTTPPFTLRGSTRSWPSGAHQLQCRAYDAAGRVGYSQVVTVHKP